MSNKYSFFPASVRTRNALPATLIQSQSMQFFKAGISAYHWHWVTWP